ncbi:MAG: EamA family transporter, partial [Aurantibacter sp.]
MIFVIFKLYAVYKIETFYAIITNYVVACLCGFYFYNGKVIISEIPQKDWFWGTLALGVLFIVVFNLTAATAQKVGVSVASVAMKMSLIIPVIFGVAVYHEKLGPLKILGIILALVAVYFASYKEKSVKVQNATLLLPLLVFLGSGIIDTSIKFIQETYIAEVEYPIFSATVFAAAALAGLVLILLKSFKKSLKINLRNIAGGMTLGVVNYFSIYFLLRALQTDT